MAVFPFPGKRRIISLMAALSEKPVKREDYDLILVRGAPGAGKTSLAERLKAHFPKGVTVEIDSLKGMVNHRDWKDTNQYHHIIEAAWMACQSYRDNGYSPVIVIDTFSSEILGEFIAMLQKSPRKPSCLVITLVCDPELLAQRIKGRKSGFSLIGPSLAINDDMRKYRVFDEFLVDTTGRSPDEVLALVLARI